MVTPPCIFTTEADEGELLAPLGQNKHWPAQDLGGPRVLRSTRSVGKEVAARARPPAGDAGDCPQAGGGTIRGVIQALDYGADIRLAQPLTAVEQRP